MRNLKSSGKGQKGQAAMEFLMTYGWAIMVVLVVIGALGYFGVLSPQRFIPEKCELSMGLTCQELVLSRTDGPPNQVYLVNNFGTDITVTNIFMATDKGSAAAKYVSCTKAGPWSLTGGQGLQYVFAAADCAITTPPAAGARLKGILRVTYTDVTTGLSKTITGNFFKDLQP